MKAKKAKRFECSCGALYNSLKEAQDCCEADRPEEFYKCVYCGEEYSFEDEAEQCCMEEKYPEREGYECGECGEFYEDKEDARGCCKW